MFKNLLKTFTADNKPAAPDRSLQEAEQSVAAGNAAEDAGRLQEALALYRHAVQLAPGLPKAHLNLGIALESLGDAAAARACHERVLALEAGHPFGAFNLAKLDYLEGRARPAEALLRQALAAKPDFVDAWVLLSNVLDALGDKQGALNAIGRALELRPDYAGALYNQAELLAQLGRLDEAEAAMAQAAGIEPDARLLEKQMMLLTKQGFAREALEPLRRAIELRPDSFGLRSRELFLLNLVEGVAPQELSERHRALGQQVEAVVPARPHPPADPGKPRLRVGFVSSDLQSHPVAQFLLPLLEHRSRERFEVFCYSTAQERDHVTAQVQALADHWVEAAQWTDAQLAEAAAAAGIDVLVDLAGHSGNVRLGVFGYRPALLQVTWAGYLNTTGLTRMDCRLSDARCDPPAQSQPLHTEQLLLLPHSQWCYRPFLAVDLAAAAPCERNGYVTFGSFNNAMKLTPEMAQRWGRVLKALPAARLVIAGISSQRKRQALLATIEAAGGEAARVVFAPRTDLAAYYRLMNEVDIALDSYPYGGGTTTFDALWMGVPVLTATGPLPASRSAASILAPLGLEAWVAQDIGDYEALAVERAGDLGAIAELRRSLRERLRISAFMAEADFARDWEAAIDRAWRERCTAA